MNKTDVRFLQLKVSRILADSLCQFIHNFTGISGRTSTPDPENTKINPADDIYVSLFFTGQVHGEFIFGTSKKELLALLNLNPGTVEQLNEALELFSEAANVASGHGLKVVGEQFNKVTLTAPRVIIGELMIPPGMEVSQTQANYQNDNHIRCYSYIDLMRLDLAVSFTDAIDKLSHTYQELSDAKASIENSDQEKLELKRLSTAKTQFLANMSHELRTPLNGMIGMLDFIKRTDLTEEQREQIDIISRSGDFLLSIINDILEFSKIESGKLEIESVEFDIRKCIDDLTSVLAHDVFRKGLELLVYVDTRIPKFIISDQVRIKQVLMNLVGNAIKFTPSGEIFVEVKLGEGQQSLSNNQSTTLLDFSVSDTGIGIPADKLEKIFFSFSQVDSSDTRKYGGSGLGLSISKSIVEVLGGTLGVESKEASGSRFFFQIPVELEMERSALAQEKETVLYLTHNHRLRQILKSYVTAIGYASIEATSINQLFEFANTTPTEKVTLLIDTLLIDQPSVLEKDLQNLKKKLVYTAFLGPHTDLSRFQPLLQKLKTACFLKKPIRYDELRTSLYNKIPLTPAPDYFKVSPKDEKQHHEGERRVLLVEDNKTNQKVAQLMLQSVGWHCFIAENGRIAVDKITDGEIYDLILMDCQMPEMDGFQATEEIRKWESTHGRSTPIIAMTANAFRETKEQCFASGMDNFITKPIKREPLMEIIDATLLKKKAS